MMGLDKARYKTEVLELLHQPWTIEIKPYSDGGFFARVVELRGCMTEGDTLAEVVEGIEEARAEWLASAIENGDPIPTPQADNDYSGKIFVRTSPQLHRAVAEEAARRGVSMSQWVSEILAGAVGLAPLLPYAKQGSKAETKDLSPGITAYLASSSSAAGPLSKGSSALLASTYYHLMLHGSGRPLSWGDIEEGEMRPAIDAELEPLIELSEGKTYRVFDAKDLNIVVEERPWEGQK